MSPVLLTPALRRLLSVLAVLHGLALVDQVWPDGDTERTRLPWTRPWVQLAQLGQRWNMFKALGPRGAYLRSEGLDAQGQARVLLPSNAPPEGPFLRLRYSRMVKVASTVTKESPTGGYSRAYAAWLCRQAPPEVVAVRLVRERLRRPTLAEHRGHPDAPTTRTDELILERPCR